MQLLTARRALAPSQPSCRGPIARRHACPRAPVQTQCFSTSEGLSRSGVRPSVLITKKETPRSVSANITAGDEPFDLWDIDGYIEGSRKHLRTVYDFERWERHRSTSRYARHLWGLPTSRMLRGMASPLLYVLGVATAVTLYEYGWHEGMLPEYMPDLEIKSKELFGLTSFALSLLLVFRTNASYERWDGARKMWGLVLNRSRDLVRQGLAWIPEERPELRKMFCRWVPAFSKSLMCHLRKGEDIEKELEGILEPHEIQAVVKSAHRPNYVLQVLAEIIKSARIPTALTVQMEQNLTAYEDCLGGCERILRTPIPLYYSRHASRFMIVWLTLLPFTLWSSAGFGTIPLSFTIAYLLLGVKEITVTIEEPFSILALEAISNTALTNVRELEAMHDVTRGVDKADGVPVSASAMVAIAELDAGNSRRLLNAGGNGLSLNGAAVSQLTTPSGN